tara:strand:- start:934 stop:1992 length:1059 start_codon:yes stop_codon:yes gene_type:complete
MTDNWLGWSVRVLLALTVIGMMVAFLKWLKGGKGNWRDLWEAIGGPLRKQTVGIVIITSFIFLVTVLLPLVHFEVSTTKTILAILGAVWVLITAWILSMVSYMAVNIVQWKYDIETDDNLRARKVHTRVRVLQRIVVVLIWLGALAGILLQFERFRTVGTTMLASAGVLSVVLGISAQKTFGAIIAGIQVALSNPINLEDVVIVEGEWGRIEEITFTYVVVRVWDQRRLIVPVTYFLEKPFQNWTRKTAEIMGTVFLHVDYTTPIEPLREHLRQLCEEARPLWDGKTCGLQVTDSGSHDITVRALVSASNASKAWDLRCLVREGLIGFMQENYPECLPKRRLIMDQEEPVDL